MKEIMLTSLIVGLAAVVVACVIACIILLITEFDRALQYSVMGQTADDDCGNSRCKGKCLTSHAETTLVEMEEAALKNLENFGAHPIADEIEYVSSYKRTKVKQSKKKKTKKKTKKVVTKKRKK